MFCNKEVLPLILFVFVLSTPLFVMLLLINVNKIFFHGDVEHRSIFYFQVVLLHN